MAPTRTILAVGRLHRFAGSGAVSAFLVTAPAAFAIAMADRLLWMPPPIAAPLILLLPGLLMGLFAVLPRHSWAGVALAGWSGGGCGTLFGAALLQAVGAAGPGPSLLQAFALASALTAAGAVGGALQQMTFDRLRPQMTQRVLAASPGAVAGVLAGLVVAWLLREAMPGRLDLTGAILAGGAACVGATMVVPSVVIWWMSAEGCVLSYRGSRGELIALIAAIALATWFGLHRWFALQHTVGMVMGLGLLLIIGTRYPVRVLAPLASLQFGFIIACWIMLPASYPGHVTAQPLTMAALQLVLLLLLFTVLILSSEHNNRRLAELRLRSYARNLGRSDDERRGEEASAVRESLAQALVGVRFALSHLQRAQLTPEAQAALGDTLDFVREAEAGADLSLRELGPHGMEIASLGSVLEDYLGRVREGAAADIEFEAAGPLEDLPLPLRRLAFRSVSELVRNALRHGAPTRVHVTVRSDARELEIAVLDDGRGFDPIPILREAERPPQLARLRDRVASEGGRFDLRSAPGAGCLVDLRVPIACA